MAIQFAKDIVKQIEERGPITVSEDCVTGEAFERWLIEENSSISEDDWINVNMNE